MAAWLLAHNCWDAIGPLSPKGARWIARHATEWVLVQLPIGHFGYCLDEPSHAAPGQPIVACIKRGEWEVLDGQHRISKALQDEQTGELVAYVPKCHADKIEY
jgi:hypothetical protein